jgi:hypothetical protein
VVEPQIYYLKVTGDVKKEVFIRGKKWQTEHRTATTAYPCYLPILGEFSRSWSCRFANAKVEEVSSYSKLESGQMHLIFTPKIFTD